MTRKPRIAFCFSGQARTLDQTYLFFQKNLFEAAKEQGFDYDVFCAVEDDDDVGKVELLNPTKVEKIKSSEVEKIIEEKYGKNRKTTIFEGYVMCFSETVKKEDNTNKFMQQLYKVTESILLAKNNNKQYDIIVRLRFDCVFFNKLNFNKIKDNLSSKDILCNKGSGIIPNETLQRRLLVINDMFFFGKEESMYILGNIFFDIKKSLKGGKPNKFISKIFYYVKVLCFYINKKVNHWIFPVLPIIYIESFFYRVLGFEKCYYYYLINQGIIVKMENFSWLVVRKQCSKTLYNFVDKNQYEI